MVFFNKNPTGWEGRKTGKGGEKGKGLNVLSLRETLFGKFHIINNSLKERIIILINIYISYIYIY